MTIAEDVESQPQLAMPPRPARPLSTLQMMRVGFSNTLAACDEELFDELFVERRYVWGRLFVLSDPEGIERVLQDNVDNYPRIDPIRRVFAFGSGSGMLCAEGEVWRRHRRLLNPTLDRRAVLADAPGLTALAEELARRLGEMPAGQALNMGEVFTHLQTRATGTVFAGDDRTIDPMVPSVPRPHNHAASSSSRWICISEVESALIVSGMKRAMKASARIQIVP